MSDDATLKFRKWTNEDFKVLRRLYPTGGTHAVYKALGGRHSRDSIKTTAYNWGIRCTVVIRKRKEGTS
jgi:hypothetical protein